MQSLTRKILFLGLAIICSSEHAYSQAQTLVDGPTLNGNCHQRRLLRYRQIWNMFWHRNEYIKKSEQVQKLIRSKMDNTDHYTLFRQHKVKTFDQATNVLMADANELAQLLIAEATTHPGRAEEVNRHLNYVKKYYRSTDIKAVCSYFEKFTPKQFTAEFNEKLRPWSPNSISLAQGEGHVDQAQGATPAASAPAQPVASEAAQPAKPVAEVRRDETPAIAPAVKPVNYPRVIITTEAVDDKASH